MSHSLQERENRTPLSPPVGLDTWDGPSDRVTAHNRVTVRVAQPSHST